MNSLKAWGESSVNSSLFVGTKESVPYLRFVYYVDFLKSAGHKIIENCSCR